MSNEQLGVVGGPVFLKRGSERTTIATVCYQHSDNVVRKVRAWKCRDVRGLMSEFGAAFQFFQGFGENWHALEECLSYLDEWLPGDGYVLVVERAEELLADEPDELRWFVAVMTDVARWWASPVADNERFNRPARPFKVVLEVSRDESSFSRRMDAAEGDMIDW
jgi:hypothetical protein